ncbi:MAG: hypothetical protein QOK05_640 [Chloroflexota bacterium]|nr:hypothetical protein [Chloroflexota bacterium]
MFPVKPTRQEWIDDVRQAEAAGFDTVTVTDHFRSSGGVFGSLIAAYDAAPSLRIGTAVLNNDFWLPSLLAREVITADVLSDGHMELGLGAGWDEPDYLAMGLERQPIGDRISKLEEAIQILRMAFAGEPVKFQGTYYNVDGGAPWPRPVQERLPLLIGGGGKRILELAARSADIVSIHRVLQAGVAASWVADAGEHGEHPDAMSERVSWVRAAAGDRFDSLQLHAILLKAVVTDRREEVALEVGPPGFSAEAVLASPHFLIGSVDQMVSDLVERRERYGISYWTLVYGNDVNAFAPVVQRLAGT